MGSLRVVLLTIGIVVVAASIVAYLLFAAPKAVAFLAGCVGFAFIFFSNAAKMLNK